MAIDYATEALKLEAFEPGESSDYWKPQPGKWKVKALSELEEAQPYIEKDESGNPRPGKLPQPQVKIQLLVENKDTKTWTFGKGQSPASTYGQIVNLAKEHGNTLKNVEFTVVVVSDGKKKKYTIV